MAVIDRHCKGSMDGDGDDDGSLAITEYRHRVVAVCLRLLCLWLTPKTLLGVRSVTPPFGSCWRW